MNIYLKMAFPALCIALAIFYTAKKKNDKNYMFPAFLMLAISLVCALTGLQI